LASEDGFTGSVLDAGCGTGENALHVASLGLSVLGIDVANTALAIARAKADDRGITVEFAAGGRAPSGAFGPYVSDGGWTADCSTPSTPTSGRNTWRA
jgi:methylase of polypeptide subunit release factors